MRWSPIRALLAAWITTPHPWSPPITSRAIRLRWTRRAERQTRPSAGSSAGRDRDDLASLVKPARRAHPVRHIRRRTLRTGAQLRQSQHAVVGAAHPLTALGRFTFGDT